MYYSIFIQLFQLYSFFLFCEISLVLKFKNKNIDINQCQDLAKRVPFIFVKNDD